MLVSSFLAWMETASTRERAEAVAIFAETVLAGAVGAEGAEAAEAALTLVLDDPAVSVRRALAMALADRADAPRHIVLSLAGDSAEVSGLLIARSPLLTDADLIELAASAEPLALVAIALRAEVAAPVSAAIVAREAHEPCLALAGNPGAEIGEGAMLRMVTLFGDRPRLRETLVARPCLPPSVRHRLMTGLAAALGRFAVAGGFQPASRSARSLEDTLIDGTLAIGAGAGLALPGFMAYLRANACLTPALLLRSVLGGQLSFLSAALVELTGFEPARVRGMLSGRSEAAIGALLARAGLPAYLVPVMAGAIRAAFRLRESEREPGLVLPVIRAAQGACIGVPGEEGLRLMALLRRFEAEAARAQSRRLGESLRQGLAQERPGLLPADIGPEMLALVDADAGLRDTSEARVDRRILRARGLVLAEPIPDLATIIAEWKAERVSSEGPKPRLGPGNANEKPGRSRVA